jgi:hypothetical protein
VDLIQPSIPLLLELLKHSDSDIRQAAIECVSSLGAQGMYSLVRPKLFLILRPRHSGLDPARDSLDCGIAEAY